MVFEDLCFQGAYEEALKMYNKALDTHIDVLGPEHPLVATTQVRTRTRTRTHACTHACAQGNIGVIYERQQKYDDAMKMYEKVRKHARTHSRTHARTHASAGTTNAI